MFHVLQGLRLILKEESKQFVDNFLIINFFLTKANHKYTFLLCVISGINILSTTLLDLFVQTFLPGYQWFSLTKIPILDDLYCNFWFVAAYLQRKRLKSGTDR